jgi:transposase
MSPAYIKGVKENFANAVIVYDKFHVVSQVSQAVEEVRRKEARQDGLAREQLEKTCWLWRKNPERWTEREEDVERQLALQNEQFDEQRAGANQMGGDAVPAASTQIAPGKPVT